MTKSSKGNIAPRPMTSAEVLEMQQLHRIITTERFIAQQIRENTAMVTDGQKVAEQKEQTARLLENFRNNWMSGKLAELGYEKGLNVTIDLATGVITS